MARKIKVSVVHEQIILGSMLANASTRRRLIKQLDVRTFAAPRHRAIFSALEELEQRGLDYVPITLRSFLPPDDSEWGGVDYLKEIEKLQSNENLEHHLERARWDTARSHIINEHLGELESALKDPRLDIDEALAIHNEIGEILRSSRGTSAIIPGEAMSAKYKAQLYARESGGHIRTSGYLSLDRKLTDPFGRSKISVITAAPSIGKTTFALNMAQRQARKWKVGYLAWESGTVAATDIICASALGIPLSTLIKSPGRMSSETRNEIDEYLDNLYSHSNNFSFLKPPDRSLYKNARGPWEINDRVLDWFESHLEDWGRDIIFWDLFTKKLPDRRPEAMSWALDRIQEMCNRTGVHIALLHQVTFKELEKQKDKRPNRGMLKGSGGWIETPDVVFGLFRRAVYEPGIQDNEMEVYCLKQRIGPWPWRIIMDWDGPHCKIDGGREAQMTVVDDEFDEI